MSAIELLNIDEEIVKELGGKQHTKTQKQTQSSFGYQWSRTDAYDTDEHKNVRREWMFEKYCNHDMSIFDKWLEGDKKIIMDAGCGSGLGSILFWGDHLKDHHFLGVDISDAIDVARENFKREGYPGDFLKVSLMDLPIEDETVDIIFSEGVLHHTDNTENAIAYLAKKLKTGGRFLFYVYVKKATIREFCDDHIREYLTPMKDEEAWEALKPLSKLGKSLGDLDINLKVEEDIPYLGIKKGELNLQRFFYWNIFKAFYRPEFTLEEMNLINFDWYRPLNCHRQTKEEVEQFCEKANLDIEHIIEQEAGITVVAQKA